MLAPLTHGVVVHSRSATKKYFLDLYAAHVGHLAPAMEYGGITRVPLATTTIVCGSSELGQAILRANRRR